LPFLPQHRNSSAKIQTFYSGTTSKRRQTKGRQTKGRQTKGRNNQNVERSKRRQTKCQNNQKVERSKISNDKIAAGIIAAGICTYLFRKRKKEKLPETKKEEKLHEIQFCIFNSCKNVLQTCKKREKKKT
jgi:hypothetical protein